MLTLGVGVSSQITYSTGWNSIDLDSWTTSGTSGTFSNTASSPCAGTGSARANNFYNKISYLVSPALTGTNGGDLTVNFAYKVTTFSSTSTGASSADFGTLKLQWATAVGGPWITAYTLDSSNHVVSASCATKSAVISGLPASGNIYLRFEAQSGSTTADNYVYIDDVSVSQGATPSCLSPSPIMADNITANSALISWTASTSNPTNGYDLYYNSTGAAPTSTTMPSYSNITGLSQSLSSLSSSTFYYVWVRSNCTSTEHSAWAAYNFYTKPDNDECSNAKVLTVNSDLLCGVTSSGATNGASASSDLAPTCGATGTNDDVWFKFTAT
ncbi:fibronectin type III domain-containing protein, partial [Chryseobacterium sp. YIM B08800]|uniref:fibronectin type III domain-containing protein n=1 Tax=Chryseobacterium sp. YIM B08800 TaxID=2984136 RepID=UPI00223F17D3